MVAEGGVREGSLNLVITKNGLNYFASMLLHEISLGLCKFINRSRGVPVMLSNLFRT